MTNKELIEEIDRRIEIETATLDDCPAREHSERWIAMLTEIKQRLEQQPLPNEELVKKITIIAEQSIDEPEFHSACNDFNFNEVKFKVELRTLLQFRQPDDELIEKIIDIVKTNIYMPQVRKDLHKLLEGRG